MSVRVHGRAPLWRRAWQALERITLARKLFWMALLALAGWVVVPRVTDVSPDGTSLVRMPSVSWPARVHPLTETPPVAFQTGVEALPTSLAGTEVDGEALADARGQLRPTRGLRQLFDYFLSLVGEEDVPRIRARLTAQLAQRLPASARAQALALFDRYVAFEMARGQLSNGADNGRADLSLAALTQRQQALQRLREQHFSSLEREAFFADEAAQEQHTLDRLAVMQDPALSAAEKAKRLKALQAALPADVREALSAPVVQQELSQLTQSWRERGGTAVELRQIREQLVGSAAADRLESLDVQRQQWQARWQAYRADLASLNSDASLSNTQRDQALQQLRAQRFSAPERLRVQALESAASAP